MEAIYIIIGILIGLAAAVINLFFHTVGALRIDRSDPTDKPYMFLEIKSGMGDILKRKFVLLKVHCEDFIPPK